MSRTLATPSTRHACPAEHKPPANDVSKGSERSGAGTYHWQPLGRRCKLPRAASVKSSREQGTMHVPRGGETRVSNVGRSGDDTYVSLAYSWAGSPTIPRVSSATWLATARPGRTLSASGGDARTVSSVRREQHSHAPRRPPQRPVYIAPNTTRPGPRQQRDQQEAARGHTVGTTAPRRAPTPTTHELPWTTSAKSRKARGAVHVPCAC